MSVTETLRRRTYYISPSIVACSNLQNCKNVLWFDEEDNDMVSFTSAWHPVPGANQLAVP
jgi:hypothetical protein